MHASRGIDRSYDIHAQYGSETVRDIDDSERARANTLD
jgi:hypothetical protein